MRKQCYEAFKLATGENAREILEDYQKLLVTKQGMRQTVKDRKAQFNKATMKLKDLVSIYTQRTPDPTPLTSGMLCR